MNKKRKSQSNNDTDKREFLVITKYPQDYMILDSRTSKPMCYQDSSNTEASMVLQEIDSINIDAYGKSMQSQYFTPNNVGVLLSVSSKAMVMAKEIFENDISKHKSDENLEKSKIGNLVVNSKTIYDYIEFIQTCIVFGYTSLEAFINLSIPDDYRFQTEPNNKGVVEIYDKDAIERWVPLKTKISELLVEIYKTRSIKSLKIWNQFIQFEELRNEIIHQKTINHTNFYKKYFRKNIFELCQVPVGIINFFFNERESKDVTNPLWPWIVNSQNEFPISHNYKSEYFTIVGNLYEGRKK